MGPFAKDCFGESTDFNRAFTRDFFYTVNHHWLDCHHVDGFRYDCVPSCRDGSLGQGYADRTYHTYRLVPAQRRRPLAALLRPGGRTTRSSAPSNWKAR
jgi:1,4-alpha-glucan branching enzyme